MHVPRVELFLQEIGRREPLYFQQRATDEKDAAYADEGYARHYYKVKFGFTEPAAASESAGAVGAAGAAEQSMPAGHNHRHPTGLSTHTYPARRQLSSSYLQGLAWVLQYYHKGCGSWTWYYPYLYAPLSSDLTQLASLPLVFDQGTPFTPLLQLLSVLPPQSAGFLPPSYAALMTDVASPLFDYYPKDFSVDANGKKNSWECVVQVSGLLVGGWG